MTSTSFEEDETGYKQLWGKRTNGENVHTAKATPTAFPPPPTDTDSLYVTAKMRIGTSTQ